ncbi:MAG: Uncharacterised protein [Synechococcus sp. MIT S9220]|nr:MAG: Uncharacterised protein [Synechococcus sp. MIT S9220]
MHRGVEVVVDQTLTHKDCVLVVVTLPGHVSDQHVLTKSDLTAFTGGTIGKHLTHDHRVSLANNRTLVQTGVLIRTLVLLEEMGVFETFFVLHHNRGGINEGDGAIHPGDRDHPRVAGNLGFQACSDQRTLRTQQRHSLTLHVGAHQCAVGVVVLQERDQGGSNRDHLHG